jgi:hypothetical protein
MSHPLTDALPSYMDALALRQACGEIEAGLRAEIAAIESRGLTPTEQHIMRRALRKKAKVLATGVFVQKPIPADMAAVLEANRWELYSRSTGGNEMSETPDNPWRTFVENVISGDNYFRASEYHELLDYIDELIVSLAAVTRERDEAREFLDSYRIVAKGLRDQLDETEDERDALRAEVERLRNVIPSLIAVQRMPNAEHEADAHNAAVRVLRAALTPAEETKT